MFHYVEVAIEPFLERASESLAQRSVSVHHSDLAKPFQLEGRFILEESKVVFPSSPSIAIRHGIDG